MQIDMKKLMFIPLLSSLGEEGMERLLAGGECVIKTFRKGQLLHGEGEQCLALEVILSGRVVVERITEEGDLMTIAAFESGDCIGGNLLFSSNPVYRLAVTASKPCQTLAIGKATLFRLFQRNTAFLARCLTDIADNALVLEGKLRYVANLSIRQRVINYLKAEQKKQGARRVLLPASKTALASQLGVQRTSLSRALQKMRDEGLIAFDRKSITLL